MFIVVQYPLDPSCHLITTHYLFTHNVFDIIAYTILMEWQFQDLYVNRRVLVVRMFVVGQYDVGPTLSKGY